MQSVSAILADIRAGKISVAETLAASRAAIAEKDSVIKAFCALPESASKNLDSLSLAGPLAGIAVGVKDIFDTFDMPTTYGSPLYADWRPKADAAIVAMLRQAGANIAGKTVTTEFAFFQPGPTVNPHDPAHTPGGSSSGSAAAVAAGMVPAALGTQTGGSVIRPAAFCGVAGYKPSFRLVPATGMKTFSWSLDTVGFFAASVEDVALFAALATGRDLASRPVDPAQLRIGLYRTAIWDEADENMCEAVEHAATLATHAGATVIEMTEPDELAEARIAHASIQNHEAARALMHEHRLCRSALSEKLLASLDRGTDTSPDEYDAARAIARRARKVATSLFEHVDVLLTPSAPGAAPKGLASTGDPKFNRLWTLTGNPCVNVPGLTTASGLPLGIQVVGRFGRDSKALSAAAWLDRLL